MMGSADIVPGVSGGTIAFIFGVYEELLLSIKTVSGQTLKLFFNGQFKLAWKSIPFSFLIPLALGIGTALLGLARLVTYLLAVYPSFLWSFFFGLVIASIVLVRRRVRNWSPLTYGALVAMAIGGYFLVGLVPIETPRTYLAYFFSGVIAICAMILPGISGSFLLLIMGKYEQILSAVTSHDFVTLGVFMAGCIIGLSLFSRLLSWLFARHHDLIVSMLIGFMIGSLRKVWPWKEVVETRLNSHGEIVPLVERNIMPLINTSFYVAVALAILGVALILVLDRVQVTREHMEDI
jgi:putative membrane protein